VDIIDETCQNVPGKDCGGRTVLATDQIDARVPIANKIDQALHLHNLRRGQANVAAQQTDRLVAVGIQQETLLLPLDNMIFVVVWPRLFLSFVLLLGGRGRGGGFL
jgi:hypothetical protein